MRALPIGSIVIRGSMFRILQGNPKKELLWSLWGLQAFYESLGLQTCKSRRFLQYLWLNLKILELGFRTPALLWVQDKLVGVSVEDPNPSTQHLKVQNIKPSQPATP